MALSFLPHAISPRERNNKRKAEPTLTKWEELPTYFNNQIAKKNRRCFHQTVKSKQNKDYPYEVRLRFGNANVPLGLDEEAKSLTDADCWKSNVPCKDWDQGKKQLIEYIEAVENHDRDVVRLLAVFLKDRPSFDTSTIPSDLLGEV